MFAGTLTNCYSFKVETYTARTGEHLLTFDMFADMLNGGHRLKNDYCYYMSVKRALCHTPGREMF
jgi:hypothetical protein